MRKLRPGGGGGENRKEAEGSCAHRSFIEEKRVAHRFSHGAGRCWSAGGSRVCQRRGEGSTPSGHAARRVFAGKAPGMGLPHQKPVKREKKPKKGTGRRREGEKKVGNGASEETG